MQRNKIFTEKTNSGGYKRKIFLVALLSLAISLLTVSAQNMASKQINLSLTNATLKELFNAIEQASNFRFLYDANEVNINARVTANYTNTSIERILREKLIDYTYEIKGNQIVVRSKQTAAAKSAQTPTKRITGVVTDETGEPIPGASVLVKNTTNGTATDVDGNFTLNNVPENATLQISYIGYITQEINVLTVDSDRFLFIKLSEDIEALEEVVVVGYGTQKKVNLTGSVEAVKGEELIKRPVMSTMLALQGLVSGVTIQSNSGQPGNEGETIRIRGIGTWNSNNPLILVDGVATSSLNTVNTNDIESISVLKDAASASIYGSRAANGVILITTKRAKTNQFLVNFSGNFGFQQPVDMPKFLGAIEFLEMYDLAISNDTRNMTTGAPGGVTYGKDYIDNYRANMASDPYRYPDTDWQKLIYQIPALQQQYNLSFSGGTDKLKALVSLNVQDQDGNFPDTNLKRYSIRVNTDYQFSDKFSASIDLLGRYYTMNEPFNLSENLGEVKRTPAIRPYINQYGQLADLAAGYNVYARGYEKFAGYSRSWGQEALASLNLSYAPFKSLRFDVFYAPKMNFTTAKSHRKMVDYYNPDGNFVKSEPTFQSLDMTKTYTLNQDVKFLVNFSKSFSDKHNVSALGGFQQITNFWENLNAYRERSEFMYDQIASFPVLNQRGNGNANEWALQSWFGRINYDFLGKYLIEANVRYDGSSRFAKGHKWGVFPSFSAGWRFSHEKFMENISWLSNGKLRASWGKLGNQEGLGEYPFSMDINLSQPVVFNRTVAYGYAATDYAMIDISWESTKMTDIGIDLAFINNKVEVVFDYYIKTTEGILLNMDIPHIMGYANSPRQNAGKVENKGWDLNIIHSNRVGDVTYRVAATLSDVKNKVLDMKGIVRNHDGVLTDREGYPINSLWGLQYDGMFPSFESAQAHPVAQWGNLQGGDIKYVDQLTVDSNGDGIPDATDGLINSDDYMVLGNTIPRYTYGLDLSVQYKGFDLGLFFQGVGKRDGYLRDGDLAWAFNNAGNIQEWQRDGMWREGQTDAKYPRLFVNSLNNTQPSSFWNQKASYFRLKNLQLGYTIPQKVLDGWFIQSVRFYISCQNVFTIKHMTEGYDPEQSDYAARNRAPFLSTYTFGFNLNF